MQHLDDDMGELFRKATEEYRLKLPEEDWDSVAKRLVNSSPLIPALEEKKRKGGNYGLWLLFFLVVMISGTAVYTFTNKQSKPVESGKNPFKTEELTQGANDIPDFSRRNEKIAKNGTLHKQKRVIQFSVTSGFPVTNKKGEHLIFGEIKDNEVISSKVEANELIIQNPDLETNRSIEIKMFKSSSNQDTNRRESEILNTTKQNSKRDGRFGKLKGLYVGIVAGPQFNQIKSQKFSGAGISAGLLAGFHFNNKLSVETGFIISEKKYFTAGEYFNMGKLAATMPAGMKVVSVQSKSSVLEIPIKIKVDFLKIKGSSLFGAAGVSSYILTHESNRYLALLNGSQESLTGNYSDKRKYFTAAINLSVGYEFKTGSGIAMRLEPYVQIPLKGIGVGSLPLLSTGIYLGITLPVLR